MKRKQEIIPEIKPIITGDGKLAYVDSTAHDDAIINTILGNMNNREAALTSEQLGKYWKEVVENNKKRGII